MTMGPCETRAEHWVKLFYHCFGFTMTCMFVEYGDPTIASHSYWIIPGSYEESF